VAADHVDRGAAIAPTLDGGLLDLKAIGARELDAVAIALGADIEDFDISNGEIM
jgi:hypothetical protein